MGSSTAKRICLFGAGWLLVISMGAVSGSGQSVSPIRFDDGLGTLAAATGDSEVLDPHVVIITSPSQGEATHNVGFTNTVRYCGDGDGCRVRLFQSDSSGSTLAAAIATGEFSTDISGALWNVFRPAGSTDEGSTADDTTEVILMTSGSDRACEFRDSSDHIYELRAANSSPQSPTDCVLRLED